MSKRELSSNRTGQVLGTRTCCARDGSGRPGERIGNAHRPVPSPLPARAGGPRVPSPARLKAAR